MSWLSQGGPKARKHSSWEHPVVTFAIHYSSVAFGTILAHDWMIKQYKGSYPSDEDSLLCSPSPHYRQTVAQFLALYFIVFFASRLALHWNTTPQSAFYIEFYKQTFLCSVTIFNAAVGLALDRPIMATSFTVAVGIDQLLWYVDLAVYSLRQVR